MRQRHLHPQEARKQAEKAYQEKRPQVVWGQLFRLLYADIVIEQNAQLVGSALADVASLLTFSPQNSEIATRQLAARAYMELKRSGDKARGIRRAKEINEQVLKTFDSVPDDCWKAEVLVHYSYALIELNDVNAQNPLLLAAPMAAACSDHYWAAMLHFTSGRFYASRFRYQEEMAELETAREMIESERFPNVISFARINLAIACVDVGDFDRALSLLEHTQGSSEDERARILAVTGFVHNLRSENLAASNDYRRAVEILKPFMTVDYYADLAELASVLIETGQLDLADRYNQEVIEHSKAIGDSSWVAKEASFNGASIARLRGRIELSYEQLAKLRQSLKKEPDADVVARLHSELAQTLAAMAGRTKEAKREFARAVDIAARARRQMASDQQRMTFSIYVERLVTRYIEFLVRQKAPAESSLKLAEEFRAQMLAEKLHSQKIPAVQRFRAIARARHAVILSYWIANGRSYLWVTNDRGTYLFPLAGLENLSRDIENHNIEIHNERELTPAASAELYRKLVAPAASMIPEGSNVIIVPSGPLAALNFETLIPDPRKPQYWLRNVTVTVAPSLSILQEENKRRGRFQSLFLVGGTTPESPREVKDLVELFPNAKKRKLMGKDATPQHFLDSKPGGSSLLHISSHASANKESPLDSYVVLTPDASHADGNLYAHDLMKLNLKEELVTLSACEGAGGKNLPGEGQVGLTWAILSAGANKVVASSFKVSDQATASFMRDFYARLAAGDKPAKALHDAKVALVDHSAVPYFWSAFQLYTR